MRVVIVDDDTFITGALKTILETTEEITVVGVGADGREALELYHEYKPDVLLMDIRMKEMSGLEAAEKILLLTTFSDDEYIIKALKAGVKGYLLKQDYQSILPALRAVCCGQSVFGTQIMEKLPELLMEKKQFDWLDREIGEKELQIISLVAEGLSNKEIAERLFLSEGTVRNYISSILDKLNLRDRTQLAVFYLNTK